MSLFWIIFPVLVFLVVLSWTDLQTHIGYAFHVACEEGMWKFPLIWVQSFFIPVGFLCSGKSKYDFTLLSRLERELRISLSTDNVDDKFRSNNTSKQISNGSMNFYIPKNAESVEINGNDKLIPPRVAFLMMAVRSEANKIHKNTKPKSLID